MRAQEHSPAEVLPALALMALRAEMEALAAVLPGLRANGRALSEPTDDAEVEAQFDNMPV